MSRIEHLLIEQAREMAARAKNRDASIQKELLEIEARKTAIEAERKNIRLAPQRALQYQARRGSTFFCPRCAIERGVEAPLSFVSDMNADRCYCEACPFEEASPLGNSR